MIIYFMYKKILHCKEKIKAKYKGEMRHPIKIIV